MAVKVDDPKPVSQPADEAENAESPEADLRRHFILFQAVPSWLVSMLVHMLVLVLLGLMTIADPVQIVNVLTASSNGEEGPEIEEFTIQEVDPGEVAESEEMTEPMVDMPETVENVEPMAVDVPMDVAMVPVDVTDFAAEMAPAGAALQSISSMTSQSFSSRSVDMKKKLLREYGGNASSESAVNKALKWIALHQTPQGGWTYQHSLVCRGACGNPGEDQHARAFNAATAMALLPFLGAGQTHMAGDYKDTVRRGLLFLVNNGKPKNFGGVQMLDFTEPGGTLYSHGLVAILLCEAYAMTEDPALMGPAQAALNFTYYAQSPSDGGWRYAPRSTVESDTSVTGWHVMAMKSGYMGHLTVPPLAVKASINFLDKVGSNNGSLYGYTDKVTSINGRGACTAIGLLCRMYTGWDKTHPGIQQGVKELAKVGVDKTDIYYNYYAAQVLRHYGGPEWDKFNVELRDWLVASQETEAGATGSWHFPDSKAHRGPLEGGRLASTSFATMILEVYYRHMPLYANNASEEDFPL
jgi:hypothetical protein